jgi:hypothetical protein
MLLCALFIIFVQTVVLASIQTISRKCGQLIQPPFSDSSFAMLKRTLDVNCFNHFHVNVDTATMIDLNIKYEDAISSVKLYEEATSGNEQTLYRAKTWLSMVAADPLSLGQRQAKECNAQLLSSYFGNEDVSSTLPVFIQSLEYMHSCFGDTLEDGNELKARMLQEYNGRISEVRRSMDVMHVAYVNVSETRQALTNMRRNFSTAIISAYNSIYS